MALPIVADNTLLQLVLRGDTQDVNDCENVLYGLYVAGGTPTPGGLTVAQVATNFLSAWAGFWTQFMAASFSSYESCTLRTVDSLVAVAPNRFKVQSSTLWTVLARTAGQVAGDPLPAFACFTIEKHTFAAGRGRQGSVRIWGVPESASLGDELDVTFRTTMQTAIDGATLGGTAYLVGAVGKTDTVFLKIMDGKAVNTVPGHPPVFYSQTIEQLILRSNVGSQLTRKLARKRRHLA